MDEEKPITLGDWLDLRQEMRAAELLFDEAQFAPTDLARYWAMSTELLALLQEIDEHLENWRQHGPGEDEREVFLRTRRRLVALLAASEEISVDADERE